MPDEADRRRLLEHYARGLELVDVDSDRVVSRTEGASPAYIKEVLRRAAVLAVTSGSGNTISGRDLDLALDELSEGGLLAHRALEFHAQSGPAAASPPAPGWQEMPPR